MKTKKILALLMAMTLTMSVALTACGEKTDGNKDKTSSGNGKDTVSADGEKPKDGEVVTITYGGWEDQLMANELARKFNERNPNIKVEVFNNGKWLGNEETTKLVATGDMPDIINLENVVVPIQNKWVIDMKPYFEKDKDASNLPENFLGYGTINDKLVMLPGSVFLFGVMLNLDLLAANGIETPAYTWNIDDFSNIVKKTTKKGSTIGVNEVRPLMKHLPAQMNPELGWGTFNEKTKQYNLGSEWEFAVQTAQDLMDANVSIYEDLDALGLPWDFEEGSAERKDVDEKRANFITELVGEVDAADAWIKGKAGAWLDFTWGMGFPNNANYGGFEWDMYPVPLAGDAKEARTAFVVDSVAITTSCKNPEAAYEFIKYISFSVEGIEDRMSIVENYDKEALQTQYPDLPETAFANPLTYSQMPVTTDQAVIDKWAEFNNIKPGVSYMLERLDTGYADGFKVTPGYNDAYELNIQKAVTDQVFTGQKTAADLAKELEEKANKITADAYAVLK